MATEKVLSAAERAQLDHVAQIDGARSPHTTKLSDGRTVARARADYERMNEHWEAERQKRKAAQAARRAAERKAEAAAKTPPADTTKQTGAQKTPAKQ